MERRKNSRVPFETTASIKFADSEYTDCETDDLSMKGIRVVGITGRTPGEDCDIALDLSGTTSALTINMKGKVVRENNGQTAFHFVEIDIDSFFHLKNIIYYNSEDPDIIEKELADA